MDNIMNRFNPPGQVYQSVGGNGLMERFMNPMTQAGLSLMTGGSPTRAAQGAQHLQMQQQNQPLRHMQMNLQFQAAQRAEAQAAAQQDYISQLPPEEQRLAALDPAGYVKGKVSNKNSARVVGDYLAVPDPTADGGYRFVLPGGEENDASSYGGFQKFKDMKSYESGLRKEFEGKTKSFGDQVEAFGRIKASVEEPSAAGDMALIFNYMKMLDPESVVRESEYATAAGAAAVPEQLKGMYNKIRSGESLSKTQRADFLNRSQRIYNESREGYMFKDKMYRDLASRNKVNPENVAVNRDRYGFQQLANVPESSFSALPTEDELPIIGTGEGSNKYKDKYGLE